jgi:signal transduction histidine kinase
MAQLDEILATRRDELVERWRQRVSGTVSAQPLPAPEIIDSLPDFLEQLIDALRRARSAAPGSPALGHSEIASEHGSQRFRAGFSIQAVVREYGILRECIFDLLDETETRVSLQEVRTMCHALSIGVTDAVTRFSQERDEQLERQASEHLAFLAHELRNPITSARFALDLLRKRRQRGDTRELDVLHRSLGKLQELIDRRDQAAPPGYSPARKCSTSSAAMHPVPAAVIAWRHLASCTSPAANTPGTLVAVEPGVVTT